MRDIVFDGEFYKGCIENYPGGESREIIYEVHGTCVFPIVGDKVLLIREQIPELGDVVKLPGGRVDGCWKGVEYCCSESHEEAAQRELFEETGYKAGSLDLLFESLGSASIRQNQSCYLARDCYESDEERQIDSSEKIVVVPSLILGAIDLAWNGKLYVPHNHLVLLAGRRLGLT